MTLMIARTPARLVAAIGLVWACGLVPSHAGVGQEGAVPEDIAYAVAVPSVPEAWNALKASPLSKMGGKVLSFPKVVPQVEEIKQQLKDVEDGLGFKLNGDTLAAIFGTVDAYLMPGERANDVTIAAVVKITDKDKFDKLVDLFERAAEKASMDGSETTGTESKVIKRSQVEGLETSEFSGAGAGTVHYATKGDLFIISNEKSEIAALARRLGGDGKSLEDSANFSKVESKLGVGAHAYFYSNTVAALSVRADDDLASLEDVLENFTPVSFSGDGVWIKADRIESVSYALIKEGEDPLGVRKLITKYPATEPLGIAAYASESSLLVYATRLLDLGMFLEAGKKVAGAAGGPDPSEIDAMLDGLDTQLGFSIRADLIPAIGNEVQLAVTSVDASGPIPQVDAALMFSVADKGKLEGILDALEKKATEAASGMAAASKEKVIATKTIEATEVRYAQLPLPGGYAPAFGIHGNYFLLATSPDTIGRMIATSKSDTNLATGTKLATTAEGMSARTHALSFMDLEGAMSVARSYLRGRPEGEDAGAILDAFTGLGLVIENSNGTAEGFESKTVLTFH